MNLGMLMQVVYITAYLAVLLFCLPAMWRLMTGYRPIKQFDPLKVSLGFVAGCLINSVIVRQGFTIHDLSRMMASGIAALSITALAVVLFLTERAIFCAGSKP